MEHMIEHETHPLKEEKQLLREINVLKKLRGQISENVCSAEEVCQALSHLEPTEMQLKVRYLSVVPLLSLFYTHKNREYIDNSSSSHLI